MNDSIMKNEPTTNASNSVENTEGKTISLKDDSSVNVETGEILSKDTEEVTSKDTESQVGTNNVDNGNNDSKMNTPTSNDGSKAVVVNINLSEGDKENIMRKEVSKLDLKSLDVQLMYEMMSVPTYSDYEYRMVTWLILWARKNNINHHFDKYGNLYFVKGKPVQGKLYPCVTAHLDTVQNKAKAYILTGAELDLKTRKNTKGQHEVYIDGMGTGSDDKNAILIALHMFKKFDTLKGAFYLGEEVGCKGSTNMDVNFFDDVSYVIGFDSPELNRAAWRLKGNVKMFTADFYKTYMKPVCDKYGMTKFYSESITDEAYITESTGLITMNFGNGGYNAHATNEYFIVEELDHALSMGIELVETIPTDRRHLVKQWIWEQDKVSGQLNRTLVDISEHDEEYLRSLGDSTRYSYNYSSNYSTYNYSSNMSDGYFDKNKDESSTKDSGISEETVKYITETYEAHIKDIKDYIKETCDNVGISFDELFAAAFSKEIKF